LFEGEFVNKVKVSRKGAAAQSEERSEPLPLSFFA
jgi:hypothetical protein